MSQNSTFSQFIGGFLGFDSDDENTKDKNQKQNTQTQNEGGEGFAFLLAEAFLRTSVPTNPTSLTGNSENCNSRENRRRDAYNERNSYEKRRK